MRGRHDVFPSPSSLKAEEFSSLADIYIFFIYLFSRENKLQLVI